MIRHLERSLIAFRVRRLNPRERMAAYFFVRVSYGVNIYPKGEYIVKGFSGQEGGA